MTESDESNTTANVFVSIKNPEISQSRADVRNDEKMAHLEKELEVLKEELRQIPFANSGLPSITPTNLPNPSKQTLCVPNCANAQPNSPLAVKTAPDLSLPNQAGTMSAYPTVQHRPGAHVETSSDAHVPPVYTFEALVYTEPVQSKYSTRLISMHKWGKMPG
ncbi:hypothetical protein HAX54_046704 [Datura stramonium]|uniref:Uncharacterized protein n=1 Tax=Datura stramonium TaxID=4076 RepID=A0ABS8SRR1_DATST|nr:hypothetical protein [Datura stramonium]